MRFFITLLTISVLGLNLFEASASDITLKAGRNSAVTFQTGKIQKAIDRVSFSGGGTVTLRGGVFLTSPLEIRSGVNLCIAEGATLLGSANLSDYPDSWAWYNMGGFDPDYIVHNGNALKMRLAWDEKLDIPVFPTVSIGWDDTPRFPAKGIDDVTHINQSAEVFEKYLRLAKDYADSHAAQQPRFVFINAWNEWVEGSYLLPDVCNGFSYLKAVQSVFAPENR